MNEPRLDPKPGLIVNAITTVAMLLVSAWAWNRLPEGSQIPVHFDAAGNPDRYGGRFEGLLLLPLISIALGVLFTYIPRIEPRRSNLIQSAKAYLAVWISVLLLFLAIHIAAVLTATGTNVPINRVVFGLIGAMFIVMGNYMGKVRSNFVFGIRTPWTLTSDLSWNKTHRLVGRLFVVVGLIALFAAVFGPSAIVLGILLGGLFGILAVAMVYSYLVWKSDPDRVSS